MARDAVPITRMRADLMNEGYALGLCAAEAATPGLGGWSRTKVEELSPLGGYGLNNEMDRCLRELAYARALLACGDYEGRGRAVYEAYARDPRGTLAEHANAILRKYDGTRSVNTAGAVLTDLGI